jgi:ribosomal protein L11 methyltransferase
MAEATDHDVHRLLDLRVPARESEIAADFLWRHGAQAVEEFLEPTDVVRLSTDLGEDPLGAYEIALSEETAIAEIALRWIAQVRCVDVAVADTWRQYVDDVVIADVRVTPAWHSAKDTEESDARLRVLIDPGGAFGMGDHPTTRGTLEIARRHTAAAEVSDILDLGCGSGILSIALLKDSTARAVAVDIARPAIEATLENATLNEVSERISVFLGDVRSVDGTFDLVLANILAPVLLADAADIVARIAPGGSIILSGFTDTRRDDILGAYEALGCVPQGEVLVDGWWSLQMKRLHKRLEVE